MTSVSPAEIYRIYSPNDGPTIMDIDTELETYAHANIAFAVYIVGIIILCCLPQFSSVSTTTMTIIVLIFTAIGGVIVAKMYNAPIKLKIERYNWLKNKLGIPKRDNGKVSGFDNLDPKNADEQKAKDILEYVELMKAKEEYYKTTRLSAKK